MNALQRDRRTQRTAKFSLEFLDDRIVPSAMHATVGAGAGAVAAVSVVHRHGHPVAHPAVQPAVQHHANATASAMAAPVTVSVFSLSHPHSSAKTGTEVAPSVVRRTPIATPAPSPPTTPVTTTPTPPVTSPSPSPTIPTSPGPLPANVSQPLQTIYQEYKSFQATGGATFTSSQANLVVLNGTNVGVQVHASNTGDFNAFIAQLKSDGMQVIASDATHGIVEGMLPITQLPNIAGLPQILSVTAMYKPILD